MSPSLASSGSMIPPHYTRSQKRTYQNAKAKKAMTNAMNIMSNNFGPPVLVVEREYQRENQKVLGRSQANHTWSNFSTSEEASIWPPRIVPSVL